MIITSTVFVLGAGASVPFGLPTGLVLSRAITDALQQGNEVYAQLRDMAKFSASEIESFREEFFYSGRNSVDAFLEHRPEFMLIGKYAIANLLIRRETPTELFAFSDHNWLRYIYSNMSGAFPDFGSNKVSFVTFNYDRTVEHFLFSALQKSHGRSTDECAEQLSKIPIVHLHGRLGYLHWQAQGGRPYRNQIDADSLKIGAENIKILHEDTSDRDEDFKRAKQLLAEAERIYFLGFGYNKTNMDRLEIKKIANASVLGTAVGLRRAEEVQILQACDNKIRLVGHDCIDLLRQDVEWN